MISRRSKFGNIVVALMLVLAATSFSVRSQIVEEAPAPILVDEFELVGECDFGGRLDSFLAELSQREGFRGYIINYKGDGELPEDRDSNPREKAIENHIEFRSFDKSRITILRGGYRAEITTELWVVAPGINAPEPSKTVPAPRIDEASTFLFAKNNLAVYGEEPSLDEYVKPAVKQREEAEREEMRRQWEAEQAVDTTEAPEPSEETSSEPAEPSDDPEPYVDNRTEEEKEAEKFLWADVGVGKYIAERKGATGVIFFYADDERYDIEKMRQLLKAGRDRLAKHAGIKRDRLKIEFGGYRQSAEAEFWFVPSKGKAPSPKPEERPVPEAADADESAEPAN